jgi:ATP-binding cassette, subfamily G (WHITE), member 2
LVDELSLALLVTCSLSLAAVGIYGSFVVFWLTYFLTLACGIAVAYLVSALAPNIDVANAAVPAYMVTLLYFSGLVMNFKSIRD